MKYGTLKGIMLGTKRILRCNPFGGYEYDPVPEKKHIIKKK
jgi:putative component of membrane protein insertase Oxa1/YidC/SpoIIIJ protein YidD